MPEPRPDTDPPETELEGYVGYNLKRAYMTLQEDFRRTLGDGGLTTRAFSALTLTVQFPQISQSELARTLGIERSGLVSIVDDLERRGYLVRAQVPGDRRVQALVPTREGIAAQARAAEAVRAHEDRLLADLSDEDRATLIELLTRIRHAGEGGE